MVDFWPPAPDLRRDNISFQFRGNDYLGHLVAPPASLGPRPLVLVIHNYQGLKFFDDDAAEYLARVGYVGLAIDLFGNIVPPDQRLYPANPDDVPAFRATCREGMDALEGDLDLFRSLMQAWLDAGLGHETVDRSCSAAAIGYCLGGMAVIEAVRGGLDLSAAVSFHGLLQTGANRLDYDTEGPGPDPDDPYNTRTVLLIENGADDHLVPNESQQQFFAEMDAAGVDWIFHHHAKTPHGFALPRTLLNPGHLHESTDRRSTMNMLCLFREVFPGVPQAPVAFNASGTSIPL
jgi:dienelactone hydrolase